MTLLCVTITALSMKVRDSAQHPARMSQTLVIRIWFVGAVAETYSVV